MKNVNNNILFEKNILFANREKGEAYQTEVVI
jgi:hypothetical protein